MMPQTLRVPGEAAFWGVETCLGCQVWNHTLISDTSLINVLCYCWHNQHSLHNQIIQSFLSFQDVSTQAARPNEAEALSAAEKRWQVPVRRFG